MMKPLRFFGLASLLFCCIQANAQESDNTLQKEKGRFYFSWGYNWSSYTNSDIHFKGSDHNFTLHDVVATDRPSKFRFSTYMDPLNATTPQFNARFGFFLNDKWEVSFALDHMKYVVQQGQVSSISGWIEEENGEITNYSADDILIAKDFLQYEHTDGLNYINLAIRRHLQFVDKKKIDLSLVLGVEAGVQLPRSDITLLEKDRSDRYHLSGYGFSLISGLKLTLFDKYFIQSELKGGYINMPKVLTSFEGDTASQDFFFSQSNFSLGGHFPLFTKKEKE